ncbi:MAG: hypothetical protein HYZ92_05500, partial [Candidatus Omnitrophica bacterium]|nr:hypothetical protein [Candidatus Omnitrophota bacterium]
GANLPPTPPAPVPPAELQALTQSLESAPPPAAPDPTPPPPGEPTATEYSGQDLIAALLSLFGVESLTELSTDLTDESNTAVQKAADTNTKIADGISTLDQLRTIDTGVFHYAFVGPVGSFVQTKKFGSPSSINGTIEAHINIDFGARTIGGNIGSSTSHVVADTSSFGGSIFADDTIEAQSFATGSGNAVFTDTNTSGLTGSLTLNNKDGVVAATATGQVTYSDTISGGNEGSASAFTVDRQSGAAP